MLFRVEWVFTVSGQEVVREPETVAADSPEQAKDFFLASHPKIFPNEIKNIVPVVSSRRSTFDEGRISLTISPTNFQRLCDIFRADKNFSMPISAPPAQKDAVVDEIPNAEEGITLASTHKMFTSYDVVFSDDPEVDALLEGSGGRAGPFFNHPVIRVFNGPRKELYNALLDAGFKPTHLEVTE